VKLFGYSRRRAPARDGRPILAPLPKLAPVVDPVYVRPEAA
jgi:hypothetical protein